MRARNGNEIGRLVRDARARSRISQRSLARRAGTSQAAISRIERGLEQPTFDRLQQILTGLGWRAEIELTPLAEHDEEPRRLLAGVNDSPTFRLENLISLSRFAEKLADAATSGRS